MSVKQKITRQDVEFALLKKTHEQGEELLCLFHNKSLAKLYENWFGFVENCYYNSETGDFEIVYDETHS